MNQLIPISELSELTQLWNASEWTILKLDLSSAFFMMCPAAERKYFSPNQIWAEHDCLFTFQKPLYRYQQPNWPVSFGFIIAMILVKMTEGSVYIYISRLQSAWEHSCAPQLQLLTVSKLFQCCLAQIWPVETSIFLKQLLGLVWYYKWPRVHSQYTVSKQLSCSRD